MTGKKEEVIFVKHLSQFDFSAETVDASLRKLLAKVELPKEAQQIDRAMEAFAKKYHDCNPLLVDSSDAVYAVAFSILLLHTDAHNKNVKRKMDKDTFIRRTKIIEGGENVPVEILDLMYDNIVLSEFTYADDSHSRPERSNSWFSKLISDTTPSPVNTPSTLSASNTSDSLNHSADVGVRLEQLMPAEDPFRYKKEPQQQIPIVDIHFLLVTAQKLCLSGVKSKYDRQNETSTFQVRVHKAGVMDRKHDGIPGGKRATARSWRPFGLILSGSQILLFSDLVSYGAWEASEKVGQRAPRRNSSVPDSVCSMSSNADLMANVQSSEVALQPVQILSLSYAICIYDRAYTKYPHVFRLITGDGNQYLLRAKTEEEMNDWMLKINYAASLKTTGVGIRSFKRRSTHEERYQRQKEAEEKVKELSDRSERQQCLLDRELQLRHTLFAFSPLQKSTRDRLLVFADQVGERIRHQRIELQRLLCYQDYLESEIAWCQLANQDRKLSLPLQDKLVKGVSQTLRGLHHLLSAPSVPKQQTLLDPERVLRRRSQSNPILPKQSLLEPPMLRTGSEDSSLKEDSQSVIILTEN
ncbi:hypothetical protein BY458DRAFT_513480 [Sporodiniella umbellata]|nr:hypothetical protein BY458DRAFT_513480 [Sporodiniella umbellata]